MNLIILGLLILLLPTTVLGAVVLLSILKPKDKFTNRVSHLRLIWLALAYPSEFIDCYRIIDTYDKPKTEQAFPWLEKDVHENFR